MLNSLKLSMIMIACCAWLAMAGGALAQSMRIETVTIVTQKGEFHFQTEIADTEQFRQTGLMFRKTMPKDRAMLFDWGRPQRAAMWMRNTHVSLDMLFIAADGSVKFIAENTVPLSRDIISAGMPVAAVLELVAGTARHIGLKRGDMVRHQMFDRP